MSSKRRSRLKSPRRITRHTSKSKAHSYRHLYPRVSKKHIRRVPLPEEYGMIPYHLSESLYDQCGKKHPLFSSTKFCKNLYKGCKDPYCTFAHSDAAARWTVEHAMEDVYFQKPHRSVLVRGIPMPDASHMPRFVLQLDDEENEDSPSMSLSQIEAIRKKWERRQKQLAHDKWVSELKKELIKKRKQHNVLLQLQNHKDSDSDMDLGD